jgi:uncharacterized protein YggU (UPF0235/DUF167 family)
VTTVTVRVTPRAASERTGPYVDGVLDLRVTRPPADGEATDAARRLLAAALGVPQSRVQLASGARSRTKRFDVAGMAPAAAEAALRRLTPAD